MKMRKINILLVACLALSAGVVQASSIGDMIQFKEMQRNVAQRKTPMITINKGVGNENLIIKQVSVGDINNVWCVANDGKDDSVYQLTETGLVRRVDGNFVAVGKEIVSIINDQHQLLELAGGQGSNFVPVAQAPALVYVSRPTERIAWGVNVNGQLVEYDHADKSWDVVKTVAGQPTTGFVSVDVNAEGVVYAVNAQGEQFKFDADRKELTKRAMQIHEEKKRGGKHSKRGKEVAVEQSVAEQTAPVVAEAVAPVVTPVVAEQAASAKKMSKKEKRAAAKAEKKAAKAEKKTAKKAAKQAAQEVAAPEADPVVQTDQQAAEQAADVLRNLIQKSEAADAAQPAAPAKKKKVKKTKKAKQAQAAEQLVADQGELIQAQV
jgi:hypothetical protein